MLNHLGTGKSEAFSAGSSPRDNQRPNPIALRVLQSAGVSVEGLRSKSWDEFAAPGAPLMDLVITVCDSAAGEACPYWPGAPATAHWGYADPSEVTGSEEQRVEAFHSTMHAIRQRLELMLALPASRLERGSLQRAARELAAR